MTGMDITSHSTLSRLRVARRAEVLRNG